MDSLEELAYAAALRRLDKQEHLVAELPGAIAVVLAAASVIASFLGQRASGALVGSSVVALAVVISASVYILAPRRRLVFAVSAGRIYDDAAGARLDP
jgi:hypothetical protein